MKKYLYANYRQFYFQRGSRPAGAWIGALTYWKPTNGGTQLNDYQYIKCKWLFELLTGSAAALRAEYGFMIEGGIARPGSALNAGRVVGVIARPGTTAKGGGRGVGTSSGGLTRNAIAAPSLLPSYWPHELLGNRYRLFNTVLRSRRALNARGGPTVKRI